MESNKSNQDNLTILVVDDHELILQATINTLEKKYQNDNILIAQTIEEAKAKIDQYKPDLTILDLSLPLKKGMTAKIEHGINFLKELMSKYPNLNILVQSSYTKALIRLKHNIDNHQGGFTIADKSISVQEMLTMVDWCLQSITHTKILNTNLEIKPEWLEVLNLAFKEGLQDKTIASRMYKSERMIRHYWTKIQDALEVYPEKGQNIRSVTLILAREKGLID